MGFPSLPEIRIEKREKPSRLLVAKTIAFSIAISFITMSCILACFGISPITAYSIMFLRALGTGYGLSFLGLKFIPLLLCSTGLLVAFRAKVWNIGAEGQLLMGAVAATWLALYAMPEAPGFLLVPCMFIVGFLAGSAWAFLPALLRAKLNVNEVITTLMMNYIAMELFNYLVQGPWRRSAYLFPETEELPEQAQLPVIPGTSVHYPTLAIAIGAVLFVAVMMWRTKIGYEVKLVGDNPEAARQAGVSAQKIVLFTMLFSGGLAGLAGVGEVAGNPAHHKLYYSPEIISAGHGYTAIIVAWLSRLNPLGLLLSAFFISLMLAGGSILKTASFRIAPTPETARALANAAHELVGIFNGVMLICLVAGELLTKYKITLRWGGRGEL